MTTPGDELAERGTDRWLRANVNVWDRENGGIRSWQPGDLVKDHVEYMEWPWIDWSQPKPLKMIVIRNEHAHDPFFHSFDMAAFKQRLGPGIQGLDFPPYAELTDD